MAAGIAAAVTGAWGVALLLRPEAWLARLCDDAQLLAPACRYQGAAPQPRAARRRIDAADPRLTPHPTPPAAPLLLFSALLQARARALLPGRQLSMLYSALAVQASTVAMACFSWQVRLRRRGPARRPALAVAPAPHTRCPPPPAPPQYVYGQVEGNLWMLLQLWSFALVAAWLTRASNKVGGWVGG
jgi:hypothetical protein